MKKKLTITEDNNKIHNHKKNIKNNTLKQSIENVFFKDKLLGGKFYIQFSKLGFEKITHERNIQN